MPGTARKPPILVPALAAILAVTFAVAPAADAPDADAVQTLLTRFRSAVVFDDGREATKLVSEGTLRFYDSIRRMALNASQDELLDVSVADQVRVLVARAMFSREELESMSGADLFSDTVRRHWLLGKSFELATFGAVEFDGPFATVGLAVDDKARGRLHLVREGGEWRMNLLPSLREYSRRGDLIQGWYRDSGDGAAIEAAEATVGHSLDATIWEPPRASAGD